MRIGVRLFLGYSIVGLLVGVVGFSGIRATQEIGAAFRQVENSVLPQLKTLEELRVLGGRILASAGDLALLQETLPNDPNAEFLRWRSKSDLHTTVAQFNGAIARLNRGLRPGDAAGAAMAMRMEQVGRALTDGSSGLILLRKGEGTAGILSAKLTFDELGQEFQDTVARALDHEREVLAASAGRVNATVAATGRAIVLVSLLTGAAALVAGVLITRSVSRPIGELERAARAVREGRLDTRARVTSSDEVGGLAAAFNQMVSDLVVARQRLDNIIASMVDPVLVLDPDGTIRRVNEATLRLLGYAEGELLNHPVSVVLAEAASLNGSDPHSLLQRGTITGVERTYLARDGRRIPVSFSGAVIRSNGAVDGLVCVAQDITARKQMEDDLRRAAEALQQSNTELSQFAYVASHDLQEPLRMVASYVQLLQRRYQGKLDGDADEFIAYAVDGASRMQTLINDLLSYSRVETRGKPMQPVSCELVLDRALTNLQMAIEESGAAVTHDPLPTVMADATQLVQLFQNLIGNALKFRGDRPPAVHVSVAEQEHEWIFSVRDNGIGIDPQYFDRIFVIFQRLHGKGEYPGTGIGLALCKKIVERHGGHISVESQAGEGATFRFTLPKTRGDDLA